jgi:Zn-dependent protease
MPIISFLTHTIYIIPGIILGFIFHEYAHAQVAVLLGDSTPKEQNKLNLKPKTHIDVLGIIFIIIAGIGWAKPVETSHKNLNRPRFYTLLIALAGPFANLVLALFICITLKFLDNNNILNYKLVILQSNKDGFNFLAYLFITFMLYAVKINIMLFIFNLIPLPPLDGFHVFESMFPSRFYKQLAFLHKYGVVVLFILIFFFHGYLSYFIDYISGSIITFFLPQNTT